VQVVTELSFSADAEPMPSVLWTTPSGLLRQHFNSLVCVTRRRKETRNVVLKLDKELHNK